MAFQIHVFRLGFHRPRITFPLIFVDHIVITNAEDMSANPPRTVAPSLLIYDVCAAT